MLYKSACAAIAVVWALGCADSATATIIGSNDFGPQAFVETFDTLTPGEYTGPLILDGVTYSFSPGGYATAAFDPLNYLCISGTCIGAVATGAVWTITFDSPVALVGGYLGGTNLVASQTGVGYYASMAFSLEAHLLYL
jgi:hypothetical protein